MLLNLISLNHPPPLTRTHTALYLTIHHLISALCPILLSIALDDNDDHNFLEDSLEPENNFNYSGHQDDSGPWDRDDLDDNNVLVAHTLKDAPANPSMAHELPVNDLSTSLDWNIEDEELLPTAF